MAASQQVTPEQLAMITDIFNQLDVDNDGKISVKELSIGVGKLEVLSGGNAAPEEAADNEVASLAMTLMDENNNGTIELQEFIDFFTMTLTQDVTGIVKVAFRLADTDKDGYVTVGELKKFAVDCGLEITDGEIEDAFRLGDPTHVGKLNFEEFLKAWKLGLDKE